MVISTAALDKALAVVRPPKPAPTITTFCGVSDQVSGGSGVCLLFCDLDMKGACAGFWAVRKRPLAPGDDILIMFADLFAEISQAIVSPQVLA